MVSFQSSLRVATTWVLLAALSGVVPLTAAQQPGVLASVASGTPAALSPSDAARMGALPRAAQQADSQAQSGASPAPTRHHVSRWVWVAIVAGVGAGVGAGVIIGNRQPGKVAATTPTVTIGAGTGVTAGAP